MNVAFIAGRHGLELSSYGDMYLVSASEILKHKENIDFYRKRSNNKYLILNSDGLKQEEILELAKELRVDEIIAPYVLFDRSQTLKNILDFVYSFDKPNEYNIMAVPQGKNKKEYLNSFDELHGEYEIDRIGLCAEIIKKCFKGRNLAESRWNAIQDIMCGLTSKPIHLMGCEEPREIVRIQQKYGAFWFTTVDSSTPYTLGLKGLCFKDNGTQPNNTELNKVNFNIKPSIINQNNILKNILSFYRACKI